MLTQSGPGNNSFPEQRLYLPEEFTPPWSVLNAFVLHLTVRERDQEREEGRGGEGGVLLVGGEGGGNECEEGKAVSVSVSPAHCRLHNERSCFPLSLRGNCSF